MPVGPPECSFPRCVGTGQLVVGRHDSIQGPKVRDFGCYTRNISELGVFFFVTLDGILGLV